MKIHDVSITTSPQTVTWDGKEQGFSYAWTQKTDTGAVCTLSILTDGAHTGTHMDAPLHFVTGGKTIDTLDIETLVGPCAVVEVYGRDSITAADCEAVPEGTKRVLFKTDNTRRKLLSDTKFHPEYVGVAPSAAQWLVSHGVRLVGVDYLSVGPYGDVNVETHRILLSAGMVVVETLMLEGIAPGPYFLAALPPKFADVEGSPCR